MWMEFGKGSRMILGCLPAVRNRRCAPWLRRSKLEPGCPCALPAGCRGGRGCPGPGRPKEACHSYGEQDRTGVRVDLPFPVLNPRMKGDI